MVNHYKFSYYINYQPKIKGIKIRLILRGTDEIGWSFLKIRNPETMINKGTPNLKLIQKILPNTNLAETHIPEVNILKNSAITIQQVLQ